MIRALENNTLGVVLASVGGALALGCLGLVIMWAMPAGSDAGDEESDNSEAAASIESLHSSGPLENYLVVSERPVFNEDRRPAPVGEEIVDAGPEIPDVVVGAPEVQLAGIIITPSMRMATLRSPDHPQSLVAFEGQPLEGDFGTWQVSRIEERMVTLSSDDGEEMQLELQVHNAEIREPPEVTRVSDRVEPEASGEEPVQQAENVQASNSGETLSRADQIRQRIEERREELRRAAEASEAGEAENYRDAIQSMINDTRKDAEELAREEGLLEDDDNE